MVKANSGFGVRNDGTPVGLDITDKTIRDISQAIAAHVEPKIYPSITVEPYGPRNIQCVKVRFSGADTPYYAYGKAYMRVADEDRQVSAKELENLILSLREAIINAFCHRDYRSPDEVRVAVFKDRVEIRNPGTLFGGLTINDLHKGNVSMRRNPLVADLLRRVHMVEAWGRGMPLILANTPNVQFQEIADIFIASFARASFEEVPDGALSSKEGDATTGTKTGTKTDTKTDTKNTVNTSEARSSIESSILEIIADNPVITLEALASQLGLTQRGVRYHTDRLRAKGALHRYGRRHGYWKVC